MSKKSLLYFEIKFLTIWVLFDCTFRQEKFFTSILSSATAQTHPQNFMYCCNHNVVWTVLVLKLEQSVNSNSRFFNCELLLDHYNSCIQYLYFVAETFNSILYVYKQHWLFSNVFNIQIILKSYILKCFRQ
jgi:hypothetical protein